jgi:hypothetical protein
MIKTNKRLKEQAIKAHEVAVREFNCAIDTIDEATVSIDGCRNGNCNSNPGIHLVAAPPVEAQAVNYQLGPFRRILSILGIL